jgi:putative glutamine amidotransferase
MRINASSTYGKEYVVEPGIPVLVNKLGFSASYLTPGTEQVASIFKRLRPDMLLLTGGNDLTQVSDTKESRERDSFEIELLSFAEQMSIPTLGICRGFQLMNVFAGGYVENVSAHSGLAHEINIESPDSPPIKTSVNSFHNYGISEASLSSQYLIMARAEDGTVEAAVHRDLPFLGMMWHPERPGGQLEISTKFILSELFGVDN